MRLYEQPNKWIRRDLRYCQAKSIERKEWAEKIDTAEK